MARLPAAARTPSELPTRDDLGQMPSARTGRHIVKLDMDAMGAPGRGLASIGAGIAQLGGALQQQQDAGEDQEIQRRLFEVENERTRILEDNRRTLTGDPDGFADEVREEFTQTGRGVFQGARESGFSERGLQRLALGLANLRERMHTRAYTYELEQRGRFGAEWVGGQIDNLANDYGRATTDDERERIITDANRAIDIGRGRFGFGVDAERLLRERAQKILEEHIMRDPWAALLGDPRNRTPSTGELSASGLDHMRRLLTPRGQTPAQAADVDRQLRRDASEVSAWIRENVRTPNPLTQLQHDALVGYALRNGRDALSEMLPTVNAGNWQATANTMRAGGLERLEQPAGGGTTPPQETGALEILPVPDERPARGARPRPSGTQIEGIVLHHTAGTTLQSAISQNQIAGTGYHYYVDREGRVYQFTPDSNRMAHIRNPGDQHRTAGAWDNLTVDNTIGISAIARNDAEVTDVQRAAIRRLVTQLSTTHNIDPSNIVGHGDIQGGPTGNRERTEGTALALELREGSTPPATGGPPSPVRLAQGPATTATDAGTGRARLPSAQPAQPNAVNDELADMLLGQALPSPMRNLPPNRRRVVTNELRRALRNDITQFVEDDIESIRRTGEPRRLPDGTTWIERAGHVFTEFQRAGLRRRIEEARLQFRSIQGLSDMTREEQELRLSQMNPDALAGQGVHYSNAVRARDYASRFVSGIRSVRERDPALAVSGTQVMVSRTSQRTDANGIVHNVPAEDDLRVLPASEVEAAFDTLRRNRRFGALTRVPGIVLEGEGAHVGEAIPDALLRPQTLRLTDPRLTPWERALVIEARQTAMARLGVPELRRWVLRADEAAELLNLPRHVSDADIGDRLRIAADRAEHLFGPRYARAAYEAAIGFRNWSGTRRETALGEAPRERSEDELNRLDQRRLDQEESLLRLNRFDDVPPGLMPPSVTTPTAPAGPADIDLLPETELPPMPGLGVRALQRFGYAPVEPPARRTETAPTNVPGVSTTRRFPRPPPAEVQYLIEHPEIWERFDRDYGPGASSEYLKLGWRGAY